MSWVPIKRLIKSSVGDRGIGASVDAAAAVEAANSFFSRKFNDPPHQLARAVSYNLGELTVACRSPAFAEEVKLFQDELLNMLRKGRNPISVSRLKFTFADDMLHPRNSVGDNEC